MSTMDWILVAVEGLVVIAFIALGLADAADLAMRVPVAAVYEPDPRNRACYDDLYAAFTGFYKRTRALYARLNRS